MPRTELCDLLGIEHPIIQAAFGPWSSVALTAAVTNAGAIGSLGTALMSPDAIADQIRRTRELTNGGPFIVNHTRRPLNEEAVELSLRERPTAISLALGDPGDLPKRAHDAGCLFINQVHSVEQAERAAEQGADAIIAQGEEAAGFGGGIGLFSLLPQVIHAVAPLPVAAAGGIADGRGMAAALILGAAGVNVGTRFLAAEETEVPEEWKRRIVESPSEDTVRIGFAEHVFPPVSQGGYEGTRPRVLRTAFVDEWNARPEDAAREGERLGGELVQAMRDGRAHELVPFTGETAGLIHDVMPVAEIVREMSSEADRVLAEAAGRYT